MGVEADAALLLGLIETVVIESAPSPVDKLEQIYDLVTSPAAAWLAEKTQSEVQTETPYYVLFVYQAGANGCYTNEMGSPNLSDIAEGARRAISLGANHAYVVRIMESVPAAGLAVTGLEPILEELRTLDAGICPGCWRELPAIAQRTRTFTCSATCHQIWIDRLVARHGETRRITHRETGKVYLVPTRVILEQGIRGSDLPNYPEVR
jgi:hypothetical protein